MNLIWRFLWTLLFSRFFASANLFDETTISFRVLPTDVDLLMHMNNGRYFSLMDLGRINFVIRSKLYPFFKKNAVYPVIASEMIRFRKSLILFQSFELTSKFLGWDDKFFYFAHHFKAAGEVYVLALIKGAFIQKGVGRLDMQTSLKLLNLENTSPPMPDWVKQWQSADQEFYDASLQRSDSISN